MQYPKWLTPYLEKSEIMRRIKDMLDSGHSDEDIAKSFGVTEEIIHGFREKWKMIRPEECPHCAERDYNPEKDCPNRHCITNWIIPTPKG